LVVRGFGAKLTRRAGGTVLRASPSSVDGTRRDSSRQRGSGTRLALERMSQEQSIDHAEIKGYYTEQFTHLAVAAAIASGVADAGVASKLRRAG
jgi:putative molybdopterin biosynthesis protein